MRCDTPVKHAAVKALGRRTHWVEEHTAHGSTRHAIVRHVSTVLDGFGRIDGVAPDTGTRPARSTRALKLRPIFPIAPVHRPQLHHDVTSKEQKSVDTRVRAASVVRSIESTVDKALLHAGEKVLAYFLVRCREPMIQTKKVHPGRRAECRCPKWRRLAFALERPVSCTGTGNGVALRAYAAEKGVDTLFGSGIADPGNDPATPRLQIECPLRCGKIRTFLIRFLPRTHRQNYPYCRNQQQSPRGAHQRPGQGVVLGDSTPDPTAGGM